MSIGKATSPLLSGLEFGFSVSLFIDVLEDEEEEEEEEALADEPGSVTDVQSHSELRRSTKEKFRTRPPN